MGSKVKENNVNHRIRKNYEFNRKILNLERGEKEISKLENWLE